MAEDGTARYLTEQALRQLEQFRSRLRQSVHTQTTALSAVLLRQFPGQLRMTVNGCRFTPEAPVEPPPGAGHRLHVFADGGRTADSFFLLSHTILDQTSRRQDDGRPFGWTCSIRQELHAADLSVLRDREIAVTCSGALDDEPLPVKLSKAATEFEDARAAGKFDLGTSTLAQELASYLRPFLTPPSQAKPAQPVFRNSRNGRRGR